MKKLINYLSTNIKEFPKSPECEIPIIWEKAQRLQEHIYKLSNNEFIFPNSNYFGQQIDFIDKKMIELHLYSNKYAKNFEDYKKRRIFWMYNFKDKV